ncbi:MAG TPA: hypothetical protein VNA20_16355 [Frankiaceae bacterium]|nr:hypothetical protein [Frankiaceae bacterium]
MRVRGVLGRRRVAEDEPGVLRVDDADNLRPAHQDLLEEELVDDPAFVLRVDVGGQREVVDELFRLLIDTS